MDDSTTGSLPAASIPATEIDIRRMVWSWATRRPTPSASRGPGSVPRSRSSSTSTWIVSRNRSDPLRS